MADTMCRTPLPPPPARPPESIAMIQALLDRQPVDTAWMTPELVAERTAREAQARARDWPELARYRAANAGIPAPDLVMIGDSLTEIWGLATPDLFGPSIVNRGIGGQTSPQILLRFMPDVVDLNPRRVHILCGTNDIAGNTGPSVPEDFQRNIRAMADIAQANGIGVLLASIPPAASMFWQPAAEPGEWIPTLNAWLRAFAASRGFAYLDYHSALTDGAGALQDHYSADGVHVTRAAYRVMRDILEAALQSPPP
jgi:lysophospholipase L1-like esterase